MLHSSAFPQSILAVLDSLVELGKAISESKEMQTADSGNPGRVTLSAIEQDNQQGLSSNELFYRRPGD